MKNVFIMSIISLLVVACNHNTKTELHITETQSFSESNIAKSEIPYVFLSGKNFKEFIDNPNLTYTEKEKIIFDFYKNVEKLNRQTVSESFASIGSTVDWDVDLISQFHHEMQETFKQDSDLLCKTFSNLDLQQVENFSRFYMGNVIWNDEFPKEIYDLQSCNQEAYSVFINIFVEVYEKQSTRKYQYDFIVHDKDGSTNLRKEATTQSDIVTVVKNTKPVTSLWRTGDWVFVKIGNQVGYIHADNLTN